MIYLNCKPGPIYAGGGSQTTAYVGDRVRNVRNTRGVAQESMHKRGLSDYTSLRGEKVHKNNFRVSLPRVKSGSLGEAVSVAQDSQLKACSRRSFGGLKSLGSLFDGEGSRREIPLLISFCQ